MLKKLTKFILFEFKLNIMINNIPQFNKFTTANNNNNITPPAQYATKSSEPKRFEEITINNDKNLFLKEYLQKKLAKENINLPEKWEISIESPEKISKQDAKLLRDIRVNIYKARVDDMFKLIEQPKDYVDNRIGEMKISQTEKDNLQLLKEKYDNYYTITLQTEDKKYNLLKLSEQDKQEIQNKHPEFAKFIDNEQNSLTEITNRFATSEIKKEVLAESGKSSRYGAYALVPVLLVLGAQAVFEQRAAAKEIAKDAEKYLNKQIEIYKEGNPLKKYFSKNGLKEYVESIKDGNNNWWRVLAIAFAGSWDDDLGAVKDFFQDNDNFGAKKATAIAIPSMVMGTLTSLVIAPLMSSMIDYSRAKAYVAKHAPDMHIPMNGKAKAALIAGNTLLGIIFSTFCSGSSWTSEALTFLQLKNNKKTLKANNVMTEDEEKKSSTWKNFMSYEAYSGKLNGILKADPAAGAGFGAPGLLTSANPYVNALATTTCGCIETITASIKQFTTDGERKRDIDKEKAELLNSI